jgi:hypothetical protein
MGELPALEAFSRSTYPRLSSQKSPLASVAHCAHRAQTIPAPSALNIYQKAHLIAFFQSMHREQVAICSEENGAYFMSCSSC